MSKTFSQEFRGISEFCKVSITQKKNSSACFNCLLWKELRRKSLVLFGYWLVKKKLIGISPTSYEFGFS